MTIAEFKQQQATIEDWLQTGPAAWVLLANSIYARVEEFTLIALFDTRELAIEYVEASRLPKGVVTMETYGYSPHRPAAMHRLFRPDSLLWDFNDPKELRQASPQATVPWCDYGHLPEDPTAPSGPVEYPEGVSLSPEGT